MKRLVAWLAGGLAAYRLVTRSRGRVAAGPPVGGADGRAEELRAKLAEARQIVDEREADEEREVTVDAAEPAPALAPEDRRRDVHEQGRAAVDEMRRSAGS
jgi:hypothetical protein